MVFRAIFMLGNNGPDFFNGLEQQGAQGIAIRWKDPCLGGAGFRHSRRKVPKVAVFGLGVRSERDCQRRLGVFNAGPVAD